MQETLQNIHREEHSEGDSGEHSITVFTQKNTFMTKQREIEMSSYIKKKLCLNAQDKVHETRNKTK
jgi:hypothetical protein